MFQDSTNNCFLKHFLDMNRAFAVDMVLPLVTDGDSNSFDHKVCAAKEVEIYTFH
jgi:hypothetical protein